MGRFFEIFEQKVEPGILQRVQPKKTEQKKNENRQI